MSSEPKNKLAFVILSYLANGFGIDRFYMGDTKKAVLKILVFVMFMVSVVQTYVVFLKFLFDESGPVQDEPVQDEPVQDEPVQDEPVQDEPPTELPMGWFYSACFFGVVMVVWNLVDTIVVLYNALTSGAKAPWGFGSATFKTESIVLAKYAAVLGVVLYTVSVLSTTMALIAVPVEESGFGSMSNKKPSKVAILKKGTMKALKMI